MIYFATALLFDRNGNLLIYLRDDKPTIPFPNRWDLFGGMVEVGETAEQALVREVEEELGITLIDYKRFRDYDCPVGDAEPNIKHVFYAKLDVLPEELELLDCGQRIESIALGDTDKYNFPHILGNIVQDFFKSGIGL